MGAFRKEDEQVQVRTGGERQSRKVTEPYLGGGGAGEGGGGGWGLLDSRVGRGRLVRVMMGARLLLHRSAVKPP